jgi:hypothetical protein
MKKAIWILWPSFVAGGLATILFFTALDPEDPGTLGRNAAYTLGFFFFWAMSAASSAFTCFLQRRADEVNRCPLTPVERPVGCPKREDPNAAC